MSILKAEIYGVKESNKWDARGYIYCWYYRIIDTRTNKVITSDNSGGGLSIIAAALHSMQSIEQALRMGLEVKGRKP
jgi:hypothetical protein